MCKVFILQVVEFELCMSYANYDRDRESWAIAWLKKRAGISYVKNIELYIG